MENILNSDLPLSLQVVLVQSEPGVGDLLVAGGEASPPADALPAGEAASADGLAALCPPLGGRARPRHTAGELLQRGAQRHDGVHLRSCLVRPRL